MPPTVKTENKYGLDWVLLNNRWYCVQNYSPTHLADGTEIPIVTDDTTWAELTTPARCVYNNNTDAEFIAKYGYLYNWFGVDEGLEMPCAGCEVPSAQEWDDLRDWMIANGFNWDHDPPTTESLTENRIGKAMASDGGEWAASATEGHVGNDQASNNSSGLNLLPGGRRGSGGIFSFFGDLGNMWGAESVSETNAQRMFVLSNSEAFGFGNISKKWGMSIRISRPYIPFSIPENSKYIITVHKR